VSYCRWSSDDYQCDVYVYEDVCGGFTTHVAGGRYVFKEPLPPPVSWDPQNMQAWFDRHDKVTQMVEDAETQAIGLPHDGESFNDDTAEECANRLEALRALGYNVPQYAIDALREEAADA
jgi:hypothetical protein